MLIRGRELDADALTYLIKGYARSANEILRDPIVPKCRHATFPPVTGNAPVDLFPPFLA
jgi:hypothetical protein